MDTSNILHGSCCDERTAMNDVMTRFYKHGAPLLQVRSSSALMAGDLSKLQGAFLRRSPYLNNFIKLQQMGLISDICYN